MQRSELRAVFTVVLHFVGQSEGGGRTLKTTLRDTLAVKVSLTELLLSILVLGTFLIQAVRSKTENVVRVTQ